MKNGVQGCENIIFIEKSGRCLYNLDKNWAILYQWVELSEWSSRRSISSDTHGLFELV